MASSLIRGKHLLTPAGAGVTTLYDAAVYQEDGVIKDVRPPYQSLRDKYQPECGTWAGWTMPSSPDWSTRTITGAGLRLCRWGLATIAWSCGFWPAGGRRPCDYYLITPVHRPEHDGVRHHHRDVQPPAGRRRYPARGTWTPCCGAFGTPVCGWHSPAFPAPRTG